MSIKGLTKTISDSQGYEHSFHVVSLVAVEVKSSKVVVSLDAYKDETAYDNGKAHVLRRAFVFTGTDYDDILDGPSVIDDCYAKIQLQDNHQGPFGAVEDWTADVKVINNA